MTERDGFMQAILDNPTDDTPRLQFADWLEEHGEQERSEFIRVQCELATHKEQKCSGPERIMEKGPGWMSCAYGDTPFGRCRWCLLKKREQELRNSMDWNAVFHRELPQLFRMTKYIDAENPLVGWRRGFIAEITLSCQDWLQYGEQLLRSTPLEKVTLSDKRPRFQPGFRPGSGDFFWLRHYSSLFGHEGHHDRSDMLPESLFIPFMARRPETTCIRYDSEAEAFAALSQACLAWARSQVSTVS